MTDDRKQKWPLSPDLLRRLSQRAHSLEITPQALLRSLLDRDEVLTIDRGIIATLMGWAPIWIFAYALRFTPQGKDLLLYVQSDASAAALFVLLLLVLCAVGSMGSTVLIAAWLFPRVGFERPNLYLPEIPQNLVRLSARESAQVIDSARAPIVASYVPPVLILVFSVLGPWLGVLVTPIFVLIVWLFVPIATRLALHFVACAFPAMLAGMAGIMLIGCLGPFWISSLGTECVGTVLILLWMAMFFGFAFSLYQSRRVPTHRYLPAILAQHTNLLVFFVIYMVAYVAAGFFWPREPYWMLPVETSKSAAERRQRQAIGDALKLFAGSSQTQMARKPLVLVTAAGGGARAAYWTASVLTHLQDRDNAFDNSVFAISSVSGGSLGAATYKAVIRAKRKGACAAQTYRACANGFLRGDFIGPSVIASASGGLVNYMMLDYPFFAHRDDALEKAWSLRWTAMAGQDTPGFDQSFDTLASAPGPALIMNGTSRVSGRPVVTSNLDLSEPLAFRDAKDGPGCLVDQYPVNPAEHLDLSVSSAILTSARFPYVSPPGLLQLRLSNAPAQHCRDWEEIVDGGIIDNEGMLTLGKLLTRVVAEAGGAETFKEKFRLVVLRISAETRPPETLTTESAPTSEPWEPLVSTLLATQEASGQDYVQAVHGATLALAGCWVEINAVRGDAPLGWTLSATSRGHLDAWLDGPGSDEWTTQYNSKDAHADDPFLSYARQVGVPGRIQTVLNQLRDQPSNTGCSH